MAAFIAVTGLCISGILAGALLAGLSATAPHLQPTPPPPADRHPSFLPPPAPPPRGPAVPPVSVRIRAYLMTGVDETAYRAFIDRVSAYLQGEGHAVQLVVNEVVLLGAGQPCGWSLGTSDLTNCVGPGMGGYVGPPLYRVGLNTNPPYGFDTDWGLHCEAHEFIHYFGVQDLYWLQTDGMSPFTSPAHPWPGEIMLDPYLAAPDLSPESSRVIDLNLGRIAGGGSAAIVSVRDRMPSELTIETPAAGQTCQLFTRERRYDTFRSRMLSSSSLAPMTNGQGAFSMAALAGDAADNNFDIYRLWCPSGEYWIHSRSAEAAYFEYSYRPEPILRCDLSGQWCALAAEPDLFAVFLPLLAQ